MVKRKSWNEFKNIGLLWFTNMILHTFGWSIVLDVDKESGEILDVYPARVKFRGFSDDINTEGYKNIAEYMECNANEIANDVKEN